MILRGILILGDLILYTAAFLTWSNMLAIMIVNHEWPSLPICLCGGILFSAIIINLKPYPPDKKPEIIVSVDSKTSKQWK